MGQSILQPPQQGRCIRRDCQPETERISRIFTRSGEDSSHLRVACVQFWHRIEIDSLLAVLLTDHVDVRKSFSYPVEHCDVALHVANSFWIVCTLKGLPLALLTKVLPFPEQQQI